MCRYDNFHTAICVEASQISLYRRAKFDILLAIPTRRFGMEISMKIKSIEELIELISSATCQFTTAKIIESKLVNAGFDKLDINTKWSDLHGKKFYISIGNSTVIAVNVGENDTKHNNIRIAASHTDSPALYIKPSPEMSVGNYGKLNVDVYGGAILNTWLDRPLSAAGKVSYKSEDVFKPNVKIVDFKESISTIPNMAIHINREVNKGIELNKQTDMAPLCATISEDFSKEDFFIDRLAKVAGIDKKDILDFEMYLYNNDKPEYIGFNNEFISAPRIDNISSVKACLDGIIKAKREDGINVCVFYDNEEIGSQTKQGADSVFVSMVLEKLMLSLGYTRDEYISSVTSGFYLSLDVAHGHHPNHPEKSDPTNINLINDGIVIKRSARQSYSTDSVSIGIIEQICDKTDIKYQKYSCRSDQTTGSTLGTIANKYLPMHCVDVGIPILAMHSARELMGVKDYLELEKLVYNYFCI